MKRSQAAMEFLLTYGWALVIVFSAGAALWYFGVLDSDGMASSFAVNTCYSSDPRLVCVDHSILYNEFLPESENNLQIRLKNMAGYTVVMKRVDIPSLQVFTHPLFDEEVPNNEYYTISLTNIQDFGPPDPQAFLKKGQHYEITAQVTIVNTLESV